MSGSGSEDTELTVFKITVSKLQRYCINNYFITKSVWECHII